MHHEFALLTKHATGNSMVGQRRIVEIGQDRLVCGYLHCEVMMRSDPGLRLFFMAFDASRLTDVGGAGKIKWWTGLATATGQPQAAASDPQQALTRQKPILSQHLFSITTILDRCASLADT